MIEEIKKKKKTLQDWVKIAETLAEINGWSGNLTGGKINFPVPILLRRMHNSKINGIIPGQQWLTKNGYGTLYQKMISHSFAFSHIPRQSYVTKEEWLEIAIDLANNNRGVLPNVGWLEENGYSGLLWAKRQYPEMFKNLDYNNLQRKLSEWIEIAENLVKLNNGKIPDTTWLLNNGYRQLYNVMMKNKDCFSHMKREYKHSFASYVEAKEIVQKKAIQRRTDYETCWKKDLQPLGLPFEPRKVYAHNSEWEGWKKFLGKE